MWKTLLASAALAALASFSTAQAAGETLYLAGYGGSFEKTLKEKVLPAWEERTGAKVVYVPGNSTDTLAKLRAQEGAQDLDVAFIDDGPMTQAIQFGYCEKVDDAVFEGIYDNARLLDNKALGVGFIATGLAYNKKVFEENGWDAPTSWNDLADPKFKGKIAIPPITNGYGLHALIMMARINGGGENNIEPGFKAFEDQIDQNVLVYEPSSGKMSELFQNGEIVLSVWGSGRLKALADQGFPGGFAYPKEGAVLLMSAICPITGSDVPELAQDLIAHIVSPEVQAILAEGFGFGPVNMNTKLSAELTASLPVGPEKVNALQPVDYTIVNPARGEWTKQWTRRIER
jgi:putative spermidine/putrescine transport system substrate-binding protein